MQRDQWYKMGYWRSWNIWKNIVEVHNNHAPKKVKVMRGNEKPHLNKTFRKAIMKRSRLTNQKDTLILEIMKYNEIVWLN